jgi:hypothetical protein
LIKSLKDESYENRLKKLHLTSMEMRRLQGGLIQVLQMFKGMDNLDVHRFFSVDKCTNQRALTKTSQA